MTEFRGWLARAEPGARFEYHRGLLIWDRSPASGLAEGDRRALAKIANAVFQAAEQGQVHLVQRRNGPFDFSYLAIKSVRAATDARSRSTACRGATLAPLFGGRVMALHIVTAEERLAEANGKTTLAIFGPPGVGKTSLLWTLPGEHDALRRPRGRHEVASRTGRATASRSAAGSMPSTSPA